MHIHGECFFNRQFGRDIVKLGKSDNRLVLKPRIYFGRRRDQLGLPRDCISLLDAVQETVFILLFHGFNMVVDFGRLVPENNAFSAFEQVK